MSENKFELIIENGVVTGYKGQSKVVEIPEGITEIAKKAFNDCQFIEEVNIKSTILKTIGKSAFEGCTNMKRCRLKALKGSIESYAFYGCRTLKKLQIPDGAIKIGTAAFGECENLFYIIIPSSVFVIEGHIFDVNNKKTVILGTFKSEAEEYANKNTLPFKENTQENRNEFLGLERKRINNEYKDFNIFGETIRCHSSIVVYEDLLNFFRRFHISFMQEAFKYLPKSVSRYDNQFKKLPYLTEEYIAKARNFLQKYGIFTSDSVFEANTVQYNLNYISTCRIIVDTYCDIYEAIMSSKADLEKKLVDEAESQITGLSYGVIGDSFTLIAHAFDEYREQTRQRKAAYAIANSKMQKGSNQIHSNAEEVYAKFMNGTGIPALEKSIKYIGEGLMKYTIDEMLKAKVINQEVLEIYDPIKSAKIIEQAKTNINVDKKYAIAMSLKMYPLNVEAIVFAIKNKLIEKDLFELIEFFKFNKEDKILDVFEKYYTYPSLVELLEKNNDFLTNEWCLVIKKLIDSKAKEILFEINNYHYEPMNITDDTWDKLVANYTILDAQNSETLKLSQDDIKGHNGKQLLSTAFAVAREEKRKAEELSQQKIREQKIAEEKRLEKERKEREKAERLAKLKEQQEKEKEKERKKKKLKAKIITIISLIIVCIIGFYVIRDIAIPLSIYNKGIEQLSNNNYADAINTLSQVYETKDAKEKILLAEKGILNNAKIGDSVLLGRCSQQETFGEESPIEWIVIDFCNNKALLLSKYALDVTVISPDESQNELNKHLKSSLEEMCDSYFNSIEKELIQTTESPEFEGMSLFILDDVEIEKYFPTEDSRKLKPTAYCYDNYNAEDLMHYYEGYVPWLTIRRDSGWLNEIDYLGPSGTFDYYGIRPAIWVSVDNLISEQEQITSNTQDIFKDTSLTKIDISKYSNMPSEIDKAYKNDDGNYVLELHAAGFGINGESYYNPSGEYIHIKVALTADGEILACKTVSQAETIGSECANPSFSSQFIGKTSSNYDEIDGISGATMTTNGYKAALAQAFKAVEILEK